MIALKPYRGTKASAIEKNDKTRVGGELQTGKQAYPWYQNTSLTAQLTIAFVIRLFLTIGLIAVTRTPIWFCLFPLACIAGFFLMGRWWQNHLNRYIGEPVLLVSAEHAARGDEIEVHFRQPIQHDLLIEKWTIELLTIGRVSYKCGTNTCTATHENVIQTEISPRQQQMTAGLMYEQRVTLMIPHASMHSFAFADNSLTWIVRTTLDSSNLPNLIESYAIQVTPEVHVL